MFYIKTFILFVGAHVGVCVPRCAHVRVCSQRTCGSQPLLSLWVLETKLQFQACLQHFPTLSQIHILYDRT